METYVAEGAACTPNIGAVGRQKRRRVALFGAAAAALLLVVLVVIDAPWWARASVFLPAVVGGTSWLQVSRDVCVMRAREGTFEHDDGTTTKMAAADLLGTRRTASRINRDGVLAALAFTALAVATAFV